MGPVALVVPPLAAAGAPTAVAAAGLVGAVLLLALLVVVVVVVVVVRSSRRRRADLRAELARSHDQVQALGRRVDELSREVDRTRGRAEQEREYVITSLSGELDVPPGAGVQELVVPPRDRDLAARLEERLLAAAAHAAPGAPQHSRTVQLTVRALALAYGVRRALSPDVLDRAVAEAHVARRRSRRDRRRQLRQGRQPRPGRAA